MGLGGKEVGREAAGSAGRVERAGRTQGTGDALQIDVPTGNEPDGAT
jgi:hypothetical protein